MEVKDAEKKEAAAKKVIGPLEKQIEILEELKKAQVDVAKTGGKALKAPKIPKGAGADLAEGLGGGLGEGLGEGIPNAIGDAIENAKGKLLEKFDELWGDVKKKFDEATAPFSEALAPFLETFEKYSPQLTEKWENLKVEARETWDELVGIISEKGAGILDIIKGDGDGMNISWEEVGARLLNSTGGLWEMIKNIFLGALEFILNLVNLQLALVTGTWQEKVDAIVQLVTDLKDRAIAIFEGFMEFILNLMGTNLDEFKQMWSDNWEMLQEILTGVFDIIKGKIAEFYDEHLKPKFEAGKKLIDDVGTAFQNITGFIQDTIGAVREVADKFSGLSLPEWLTPGSPTPFENALRTISEKLSGIFKRGLTGASDTITRLLQPSLEDLQLVLENLQLILDEQTDLLVDSAIPTWSELGELLTTSVTRAVNGVNAGLDKVTNNMITITNVIKKVFKPAMEDLSTLLSEAFAEAGATVIVILNDMEKGFDAVAAAIEGACAFVAMLITLMRQLSEEEPDWLRAHSPPKMATAFNDIGEAMNSVSMSSIPMMRAGLMGLGNVSGDNYEMNLNIQTTESEPSIQENYQLARAMFMPS